MDLTTAIKEAVQQALNDNLEVDIDAFNGKLSVEIYYDGEMVADAAVDLDEIKDAIR